MLLGLGVVLFVGLLWLVQTTVGIEAALWFLFDLAAAHNEYRPGSGYR